ncbi:MAG: hypothetical protein IJC50_02225 [Clostridia bacterium]|nr:hypothetical protein [Clostridia bacterium]
MIYKGTQKKMIMLKNTGSEYFEEAYFIMKDEAATASKQCRSENDMIKEANRIISETFTSNGCSARETKQRFVNSKRFWYVAGLLCGTAAATLFRLIFLS